MSTSFTTIYDCFLGKITDDMYLELTPLDTAKDLQRLLINSISGFEFPRKNLYDYTISLEVLQEKDIKENDFVIGNIWLLISSEDNIEDDFSEENLSQNSVWYSMVEEQIDIDNDLHPGCDKFLIEKSFFTAELTMEEIDILAILMMNGWLQRQITSVENTRMKYSGNDFKMTSQANHLSKLQSLLGECQRQSHHMQRLYKRRALNNDGIYESTWSWFGSHGTTNIRR